MSSDFADAKELVRLITGARGNTRSVTMFCGSFKVADIVQGDGVQIEPPKTDKEVTKFIIERTQTYRQSWLLSPLSKAIELIQSNGTQPQPPAAKE